MNGGTTESVDVATVSVPGSVMFTPIPNMTFTHSRLAVSGFLAFAQGFLGGRIRLDVALKGEVEYAVREWSQHDCLPNPLAQEVLGVEVHGPVVIWGLQVKGADIAPGPLPESLKAMLDMFATRYR